jgi:uncharacterized protein (TIGR03435 family)
MKSTVAACLIFLCSAFGQESRSKFEAASVKPSARGISRIEGGPGTTDPGRITYSKETLKDLLLIAYGAQEFQIAGPEWMDTEAYEIAAILPPGSTEEQGREMLRNLLVERFHLAVHKEPRVMSVYELEVAESGLRLKQAELRGAPAPEPDSKSQLPRIAADKNGFLEIPPGRPQMVFKLADGMIRWTARMQSPWDLTGFLGRQLRRPVIDKTGLTGRFDFTLAYSQSLAAADATPSGGPSLQRAVRDQLGLKLESAKEPVDVMVIDQADKVPTAD